MAWERRVLLRISILALGLSGCSTTGLQPSSGFSAQIGQPTDPSERTALGAQLQGLKRATPDIASTDLLYIGNYKSVTVYSYPQGTLVRTLRGFQLASGECVDKNANVYITNLDSGYIFEYAHGDPKRISTLHSDNTPVGCAIDPTTGNLAVSGLGGAVEIYKNARGKPTEFLHRGMPTFYWCAYDDAGNLYVDGQDQHSRFKFAKLAKDSRALTTVNLNEEIYWPGGVQWNGKYIAVGDQGKPYVYQFAINGNRGTKVSSTPLGSGAWDTYQFFIDGSTVVVPNLARGPRSDVLFYNFPVGGKATKKITKGVFEPGSAVISRAQR